MAQSGIRDRNIRSSAKFPLEVVTFYLPAADCVQSQTAVEKAAAVMPYAGVVEAVAYYSPSVTTGAAQSLEVVKNQTAGNIQSAVTSMGATGTVVKKLASLLTTGPAYAGGRPAFAAGDILSVLITTGSGDSMVNCSVTVLVRPFLGSLERTAAGLQD